MSALVPVSGLTNSLLLVRTGRFRLLDFYLFNENAAQSFVRFYDAAAVADVTLGTTPVLFQAGVSANAPLTALPERIFTQGLVLVAASTSADIGAPPAPAAPLFGWATTDEA